MAKRHAAFIGLSHDHHHTLALALRLRQGDGALLTEGWTHDPSEQIRRFQHFFEVDLRPHFAAEEKILFPAVERSLPALTGVVGVLCRQHREVEGLLEALKNAAGAERRGLLAKIGSLLEDHVRREERELFPACESRLPEEALVRLGTGIRAIRKGRN